jgi:hypothetical protein
MPTYELANRSDPGASAANSKSPHVANPFNMWLNSSSKVTKDSHNEHLQEAEKLVKEEAKKSKGDLKYRFMTQGPRFDIPL